METKMTQDGSQLAGVKSVDRQSLEDRRGAHRVKLSLSARIEPEDAKYEAEISRVSSSSRSGFCFETAKTHYYRGMRLRVICPYLASNRDISMHSYAEVTRVTRVPCNRLGVAVRYLLR